jgi:hypothetical protein
MWNNMPEKEREHYVKLAKDGQNEYKERLMEYRATGHWAPFSTVIRLDNNKNNAVVPVSTDRNTGSGGPWVRIPYEEKNALEKELDTYGQVIFPPRPLGMEEEYEKRVKKSREKRKEKIQKEGLKFAA